MRDHVAEVIDARLDLLRAKLKLVATEMQASGAYGGPSGDAAILQTLERIGLPTNSGAGG